MKLNEILKKEIEITVNKFYVKSGLIAMMKSKVT